METQKSTAEAVLKLLLKETNGRDPLLLFYLAASELLFVVACNAKNERY